MITKDEFDRVQMLLGRSCKQRLRTHEFPLTGIIRCGECDAMVTAEEKWQIICPVCKTKFNSYNKTACSNCNINIEEMIKPKLLHYIYYHCTKRKNPNCLQKSIRAEELEKQVDDTLKNIQISDRFKNWALKYLNKLNDEEIDTHSATITSLQTSYTNCVKRLDNLVKLKISPNNSDGSLLSDEEFKAQKIKLIEEKAKLEEQMGGQGKRITQWVELVEKNFNFATQARYKFATGTAEEKREILVTIGSNLKLFNKILRIELQNDYGFLEKATKNEPSTSYMFEPSKKADDTAQFEDVWVKNLTLLPRWNTTSTEKWLREKWINNNPQPLFLSF